MRKTWVGHTFLFLFLWFRRCRNVGLLHTDARFHGTDGGDGPDQILALLARQQAVLANQGIQIIDQRIQFGFLISFFCSHSLHVVSVSPGSHSPGW